MESYMYPHMSYMGHSGFTQLPYTDPDGSPHDEQSLGFETPTPLEQLRALDRSSIRFHERLIDLLGGKEFKACIPTLQKESDATWLINFLDEVLRELDGKAFVTSLRTLRKVCCTHRVLPTSYTVGPILPVPEGPFGGVTKATLDGTPVAAKRLEVYTTEDKDKLMEKQFFKAAVMWRSLQHQNVLPLLGVEVESSVMITKWMSNGNIIEHLRMKPDANREALLHDVIEALEYIHGQEIVHGDLKGMNILINNDGRASVSGFGLSTVMHGESTSLGGTLRWTAPEILDGTGCTTKQSDIYSFAMVIYEVFAGVAPFALSPPTTVAVQVLSGNRPKRPSHPGLSDELWVLTQRCWAQNPLSRPEIGDVLSQFRAALLRPSGGVQVNGGASLGGVLGKFSEWPNRAPSSIRRLFSRFRGSRLGIDNSSPASNGCNISFHLYDSCVSVDSWEK